MWHRGWADDFALTLLASAVWGMVSVLAKPLGYWLAPRGSPYQKGVGALLFSIYIELAVGIFGLPLFKRCTPEFKRQLLRAVRFTEYEGHGRETWYDQDNDSICTLETLPEEKLPPLYPSTVGTHLDPFDYCCKGGDYDQSLVLILSGTVDKLVGDAPAGDDRLLEFSFTALSPSNAKVLRKCFVKAVRVPGSGDTAMLVAGTTAAR